MHRAQASPGGRLCPDWVNSHLPSPEEQGPSNPLAAAGLTAPNALPSQTSNGPCSLWACRPAPSLAGAHSYCHCHWPPQFSLHGACLKSQEVVGTVALHLPGRSGDGRFSDSETSVSKRGSPLETGSFAARSLLFPQAGAQHHWVHAGWGGEVRWPPFVTWGFASCLLHSAGTSPSSPMGRLSPEPAAKSLPKPLRLHVPVPCLAREGCSVWWLCQTPMGLTGSWKGGTREIRAKALAFPVPEHSPASPSETG